MHDTHNEYGLDESAILTLAEFYFECGFTQDQAVKMAWHTATAPYREEF